MNQLDELIKMRFCGFLDRQMDHLRRMREYLDVFRAALIRRDEDELYAIRASLSQEARRREELDREQDTLRRLLAGPLGCRPDEVCVSRLLAAADPSTRRLLQDKQQQARDLVEEIKTVHLATELLLRECARINRRMLETVTGRNRPAPTYDSRGRTHAASVRGLMNMKL